VHDAVGELCDRYLELLRRLASEGLDGAIELREAASPPRGSTEALS